ncbi:hypothetical protein FOL47_008187 [Perkinsus chesapeaki]|uniref:Major facilitator superfamily (MFS) profile domain-containing protein n=1 Tax=Perkinsus chesapeaki TaxID=330153 RepID=A0A7J6MVH8_PERCH|nr:hypothetical protein FOL47_008187 [Perkinsus chesapeaki]
MATKSPKSTPSTEEEDIPLFVPGKRSASTELADQEFEARWERVRRLLYVVCAIEGTDMLLLPSCYRAMEVDLGLSPSSLGYLAMGQAFWQASAAPIWGAVSDAMSRRIVLTTGVAGWALFTALTSAASSFWVLFIIRCFNGIALASIMPVSQSVVADVSLSQNRGSTFGFIQSFTSLGQIFASLFGTWLSGIMIAPGYMGWRLAFLLTGVISALLAIALLFFFEEPPRGAADFHEGIKVDPVMASPSRTWFESLTEEYRKLFYYLREVRSFVVIVLQGCFGTIPWGAFTFATLWFQYIGFSDRAAGSLIVLYMAAAVVGGVLGGNLGDWATRRWRGTPPHMGRMHPY